MRTRSFIGLILLVAILMIVSIPALLQPAAAGTETVLVKSGLIEDQQATYERAKKLDASQTEQKVTQRVMLKGHDLNAKTGDLRDTIPAIERNSNQRGRLTAGSMRVLLPGQQELQDAYSRPPVMTTDGLVLDDTGCPVVPPDANLATLFEDASTKRLYQQKANAADNPKACSQSINQRLEDDQDDTPAKLPGDRRQDSALLRGDSDRMLLDTYASELYDEFFGVGSADEDTAKSDTATATSASRPAGS